MILRSYQRDLYERVRKEFAAGKRRVFMALPTGAGKTVIFAAMAAGARRKGRTTWICVPRRELLEQSSASLCEIDVAHGRIDASHQESAAYGLHIVSKDTLLRRYGKIRTSPDFIILDEAHLYYDQQTEIQQRYPDARIVGVSASPERLDGRGLSDLYDTLVQGPDIAWLIERHYLVPVRYYAPPIEGLDKIRRSGFDYNERDVDELLERAKIYGSAIDHYERLARGKTALVFTRTVAAAERVAAKFQAGGWRFLAVSAKTPSSERKTIIDALRAGEIHGVVNCEIAAYGLDVPRVDCLILLRPTLSKALQTQMIGRGLRTHPGKTHCVILDHVGMLAEHGHPLDPYEWRFDGHERRQHNRSTEVDPHLCPVTWLYCTRPNCLGCEHNPEGELDLRAPAPEVEIDGDLVEVRSAVKLRDRPLVERKEYEERRAGPLLRALEAIDRNDYTAARGPIGELLALAREVGHKPMSVYHRLWNEDRVTVNLPLLHEIAWHEGYKPGWVWFQAQQIRKRLRPRRVG